MTSDPLDDLRRSARDVIYVGVGFGVLGFQKLQVRRRELERTLATGVPVDPADIGRLVGRLARRD